MLRETAKMTTQEGTKTVQWTCGCGKEVRLIMEARYGKPGREGKAAQTTPRPTHCEKDRQEQTLAGRVLEFSELCGSEWVAAKRWS